MDEEHLCTTVRADAVETNLRIEAFRLAERPPQQPTEATLRAAINADMARSRSKVDSGFPQPPLPRVGYTAPWADDVEGAFGHGVAWVDLRRPKWLHPLPADHHAMDRVIETAARSQERIPGMRLVPSPVLDRYVRHYEAARLIYDRQPAPLLEATSVHRSIRSAMLTSFRKRSRALGNPTATLSFADLILIEASAGEAAIDVLRAWLADHCP